MITFTVNFLLGSAILLFLVTCLLIVMGRVNISGGNISHQFIILASLVSVLSILITSYCNIFFEHNNNFGKAIKDSTFLRSKYDIKNSIEESVKKDNMTIICIDKSGSVTENVELPEWITQDFKDQIGPMFNIIDAEFPKHTEDSISYFNINKYRAAKALLELIHLDTEFGVYTFGDETEKIFPPDKESVPSTEENIEEALGHIFRLTTTGVDGTTVQHTDFLELYKDMFQRFDFKKRSMDEYTSYTWVILSDFYHDVEDLPRVDQIDQLKHYIEEKTKIDSYLNLFLLKNEGSPENEEYVDVLKLYREIYSKQKTNLTYIELENINSFVLTEKYSLDKIKIAYRSKDAADCTASLKFPENGKSDFRISLLNFDNSSFGQFFIRAHLKGEKGRNQETWTPIYPDQEEEFEKFLPKDIVKLRFKGTVYDQYPKAYLKFYFPTKRISCYSEIVFTKMLPIPILVSIILIIIFILYIEYRLLKPLIRIQRS